MSPIVKQFLAANGIVISADGFYRNPFFPTTVWVLPANAFDVFMANIRNDSGIIRGKTSNGVTYFTSEGGIIYFSPLTFNTVRLYDLETYKVLSPKVTKEIIKNDRVPFISPASKFALQLAATTDEMLEEKENTLLSQKRKAEFYAENVKQAKETTEALYNPNGTNILKELLDAVWIFDFYYNMSDDAQVFRTGRKLEAELQKQLELQGLRGKEVFDHIFSVRRTLNNS